MKMLCRLLGWFYTSPTYEPVKAQITYYGSKDADK
jgi:hypothetical protein